MKINRTTRRNTNTGRHTLRNTKGGATVSLSRDDQARERHSTAAPEIHPSITKGKDVRIQETVS